MARRLHGRAGPRAKLDLAAVLGEVLAAKPGEQRFPEGRFDGIEPPGEIVPPESARFREALRSYPRLEAHRL